jgi:hypothetical protein
MSVRALAALAVLALAGPAVAAPAPVFAPASLPGAPPSRPPDPATILRAADAAGAANDWPHAATLLATLDLAHLDPADRAEARRLRGLAAFFAGNLQAAEVELVEWLKLDLDARLDPSTTPPEAMTFFERVRARHAAELRALRPRPRRGSSALNLLPPWGQFQNGDRTKGWIIAGTGIALLAADVGSYAFLRHWCSPSDLTCDVGGEHASAARTLRTVNLVSGGALLALYAYGVVDGFWGYRSQSAEVMFVPTSDGIQVMFAGRF